MRGQIGEQKSLSAISLKCLLFLTSQAMNLQIHGCIEKWLHGAGDRDGGKSQRTREAFNAQHINGSCTHVCTYALATPVVNHILSLIRLHWSMMTSDSSEHLESRLSHCTVQNAAYCMLIMDRQAIATYVNCICSRAFSKVLVQNALMGPADYFPNYFFLHTM